MGDLMELEILCTDAGDLRGFEKCCTCAGDGGGRDATGEAIGTEYTGDGIGAAPLGEGTGCARGVWGVCGCCGDGFDMELAADTDGGPNPCCDGGPLLEEAPLLLEKRLLIPMDPLVFCP